jgi:hypothetical protein
MSTFRYVILFPQNILKSVKIKKIMRFFKILKINDLKFVCVLQMMSAIKSGAVTYSRFATIAEIEEEHVEREKLKKNITVDRSGGGF